MPPKSKRPFRVPGCKVMKGLSRNDKIIKKTRDACTQHKYTYLLSMENCNNTFLFGLRSHMRGSALVYGNNKLQQVALGKSAEDELKEGVSRISKQLKFEKALLFTDLSDPQVRRRFDGYTPACHAKPGTTALSTVTLKKGPEVFLKWPASEENKFRELGLPVAVESGKIHLLEDITVCRVGETLTPQAAQLLKKVDAKTARLTVNIEDVWTNPDPVENKKKKKKQDNGGEGEGEEEDSGEEEEGGEEMEEAPGV